MEDVAIAMDGSVFLTGTTYGNWGNSTNAGSGDIFVVKLDSDGNELWNWQVTFSLNAA